MAGQKCWECRNYSCSWTQDRIPVDGWTAEKVERREGATYSISDCPEFIGNIRKKEPEKKAPEEKAPLVNWPVKKQKPAPASKRREARACCLECNEITRAVCESGNKTCNTYHKKPQKPKKEPKPKKPPKSRKAPKDRRKFTDEKLIELFNSGMTMDNLSEVLGACKTTIHKHRKRLGLEPRKIHKKPREGNKRFVNEADLSILYWEGWSNTDIASILGFDIATIVRAKHRFGMFGNGKATPQYSISNAGKEIARGSLNKCSVMLGLSTATTRRIIEGFSKKYRYEVARI